MMQRLTDEQIIEMVDGALAKANREDDLDTVVVRKNATWRHVIALCKMIRDWQPGDNG